MAIIEEKYTVNTGSISKPEFCLGAGIGKI